jgi:hypothetical protein
MNLKSFVLLFAGALALAGCSSTSTKVDRGPIRAQTFSFVDPGPKAAPAYADNTQAAHAMIQKAITQNLAGKGVTRVEKGGDVTVAYLLILGNNASTTSIDEYFGHGEDASALHAKAQDAYSASKNPNYFEAGTLIIDIIDARSFKLLKRSYATRQVLRTATDETRAARIQEVVNEILGDLRIAS